MFTGLGARAPDVPVKMHDEQGSEVILEEARKRWEKEEGKGKREKGKTRHEEITIPLDNLT